MNGSGLNEAQWAAVHHEGGPLLILAGAGSGKTRVVTHRIARQIQAGEPVSSFLALTFTNKAAAEMRERTADLSGCAPRDLRISTFHSLCARLLRGNSHVARLSPRFSIYDDEERTRLVRSLLQELGRPHDAAALQQELGRIEDAKNQALRVHDVRTQARGMDGEEFAELFAAYREALHDANACDFGDLIAHVVHALEDRPEFREALRATIRHLLVDEFQDTNVAQYRLIQLLSPESGDLVVVGDDDQAIYGWRGATVENVERFRSDNPTCTLIALEQNYRSGPAILKAAHSVVETLPGRIDKRLFTTRNDERLVQLFVGQSDYEEADFLAREILRLRELQGRLWSDFAILVRTNAQTRVLEGRLRSHGIPYGLRGAQAFFDRREIRDGLAYLRLALNPGDTAAFTRIANTPKRALGPGSLKRLLDFHGATGSSSYRETLAMALESRGTVTSRMRKGTEELLRILEALEPLAVRGNAAEAMEAVLTESGLEAWYLDSDEVNGAERARNLRELCESARTFESPDGETTPLAFVESLTLAPLRDDEGESVHVMTAHAAKGLEFPVVFMVGLEQGIFPHERNRVVEDPDEERRLCYVAFTRAKETLLLTTALRRSLYGRSLETSPSEYWLDLPEDTFAFVDESALKVRDWRRTPKAESAPWDDLGAAVREAPDEFDQRPWQERHARVPAEGLVFDEPPPAAQVQDDGFQGAQVRHKLFGEGRVVKSELDGGKHYLTIEFAAGKKRVARQYVERVGR